MQVSKHLITFYRPQCFAELKGQGPIKKVLMRSAKEGKIANAYIFSGTRGVGKTSVARIFAKAINCRNRPCEEPCNKCDICADITKGLCLDVMEIDGASHTGVDNIRKLIEDISLSPIKCKYRVVIIDEVHMLSKSAFNALLKTLEEPPPHVVFILATTEAHKIPATIKSRCQHFIFKKLTTSEIVEHLKEILKKESISYEEDGLFILAKKGGGSVRDTLSMLSQLVAISDGKITSALVREVLGIAPQEIMIRLVEFVAKKDIISLVKEIKSLLDQGIDIPYFLKEFTGLWRDLFFFKSSGMVVSSDSTHYSDLDVLKKIVSLFSLSQIHGAWQMLVNAQAKLERAQDPVIFLELLFVNMAYLPDLIPITRSKEIFQQPGDMDNTEQVNVKSPTKDRSIETRETEHNIDLDIDSKSIHTKNWENFLIFLKKQKKIKEFPHINICMGEIQDKKIKITCPGVWLDRLKTEPARYSLLQKMIKDFFGQDIEIEFNVKKSEDKNSVKKRVLGDPIIKNVIEVLDAKLADVHFKNT